MRALGSGCSSHFGKLNLPSHSGQKIAQVSVEIVFWADEIHSESLITVLSLVARSNRRSILSGGSSSRESLRGDYLGIVLVGPVLVFAALTLTATLQSNSFDRNLLAARFMLGRAAESGSKRF
jgi:hypothetical protein